MTLAQLNGPADLSEEEILREPTNKLLLEAASRFSRLLNRLGYPVQACSKAAIRRLAEIPPSRKEEILSDFESECLWIEALDPSSSPDNEIALLDRALDKHGFEVDREFREKIGKDHIIEFYNEDMIQLYRSFNFYKITGYSLLDIALFEWYVLWERSSLAQESLRDELAKTLRFGTPVKRFNTGRHLVREVLNVSSSRRFVPRAAILEPLHLGSLKPSMTGTHRKKGFICTSTGEMIAFGKAVEDIEFI